MSTRLQHQDFKVRTADFSKKTRELLAERAGYTCSFPQCDVRTNGPTDREDGKLRTGVAAHIYSSSPDGPRGNGGLSEEERSKAANGIWLCENHARVIDNNKGQDFSAQTLLSYKQLHESRVRSELLGTFEAQGWLHEVHLNATPLFEPGANVKLSKLNLFYGNNGAGKTHLSKLLLGVFNARHIPELYLNTDSTVDVQASYFLPEKNNIRFRKVPGNSISYEIDSSYAPFNPLPMNVFYVSELKNVRDEADKSVLARTLGIQHWMMEPLAQEVNRYENARVHNLRFVNSGSGMQLRSDVEGTSPDLPFKVLSGREKERVLIEFATAAARASGRYCPTVLVLDHPFVMFDGWFDYYCDHFLSRENGFQTIMCLPTGSVDLNAVEWLGWEVVRLKKGEHGRQVTQSPKLS